MRASAELLGRSGFPVVFRHPGGGELTLGPAASVASLAASAPGRVCVVDVKQDPVPVPSAELISFPMEDSLAATPSAEALARLLGRVDRRLAAGRDVHVACAMGRSRSAMVVTNYVAALLGVEFREALALVRYAYPDANPNPGFRDRSAELAVEFAAEVSRLEVDRAVIDGWHASHSPAWL